MLDVPSKLKGKSIKTLSLKELNEEANKIDQFIKKETEKMKERRMYANDFESFYKKESTQKKKHRGDDYIPNPFD
jgi:hypothetical protein